MRAETWTKHPAYCFGHHHNAIPCRINVLTGKRQNSHITYSPHCSWFSNHPSSQNAKVRFTNMAKRPHAHIHCHKRWSQVFTMHAKAGCSLLHRDTNGDPLHADQCRPPIKHISAERAGGPPGSPGRAEFESTSWS